MQHPSSDARFESDNIMAAKGSACNRPYNPERSFIPHALPSKNATSKPRDISYRQEPGRQTDALSWYQGQKGQNNQTPDTVYISSSVVPDRAWDVQVNYYDNARCESFFDTLKTEEVYFNRTSKPGTISNAVIRPWARHSYP